MRAISQAASKADASRLRRRCNELIAYAERLKTQIASSSALDGERSSQSSLLSKETAILQRSSDLQGNHFPPWDFQPLSMEFERPIDNKLYMCVRSLSAV